MVFEHFFFQKQWDLIGLEICEWVKAVFAGKSIEPELNNTLLVLILKVPSPENFSQFRPISLCSMMYKLVMKVNASHFKIGFPKIIGHEHTGFIVGCSITDNILIAQEVIHLMISKHMSIN